jgi:filamentous hemagglutinin family protein
MLPPQRLRAARSALLNKALVVILCLGAVAVAGPSDAQIHLDGTMGPRGTLTGPHYAIDAAHGQVRGSNLFHSFGTFNVRGGESATFTGPGSVDNVIGRVTGGSRSEINGLLRCSIDGANLFLLNPSGILFGADARLDVSGSFHASTADALRFADGATLHANPIESSVLSAAPPAAFGFLGKEPQGISLAGSHLQVPAGKTLSMVGGDLLVSSGALYAPSGEINMTSVASQGEVSITPHNINVNSFRELGKINIFDSNMAAGNLLGAFEQAGSIFMKSEILNINSTNILNRSSSAIDSQGLISIYVRNNMSLMNHSTITAFADYTGKGADIDLSAGSLTVRDGSQVGAVSRGSGRGGDLRVDARNSVSISGYGFDATGALWLSGLYNNAVATGDAGEVIVTAGSLVVKDGAEIGTTTAGAGEGGRITADVRGAVTLSGAMMDWTGAIRSSGLFSNAAAAGDAGEVVLKAGSLAVKDGAQVNTTSRGSGKGGRLSVTAEDAVVLSGYVWDAYGTAWSTGLASEAFAAGDAGEVVLKAGSLVVRDGAEVSTTSRGAGKGGRLSVAVDGPATLSGYGLDRTGNLLPTGLFSETFGEGEAGEIRLEVGSLNVQNGAVINNTSEGAGRGGRLSVTARDAVTLSGFAADGHGRTWSTGLASEASSSGDAGEIVVSARAVNLMDGAAMSGTTFGSGQGGRLTVTAKDSVTLSGFRIDGHGVLTPTRLSSEAYATGNAGEIFVQAGSLDVCEGAQINTTNWGPGKGGRLSVTATGRATLTGYGLDPAGETWGSGLYSESYGKGDAGEILLNVGSLTMRDGALINNTGWKAGQGGRLSVTAADAISLSGFALDKKGEAWPTGFTSEAFVAADAGEIVIQARTLALSDGAAITGTTYGSGEGGRLSVTAGESIAISGYALDGQGVAWPSGLFSQSVGAGSGGSIVVQARDVLLSNGGTISAESGGQGDAGEIAIQAGTLALRDGAAITGTTYGPGEGGRLRVVAGESIAISGYALDGQGVAWPSGLFSQSAGAGSGGSIVVQARDVLLSSGGTISAESARRGNAGNVEIVVEDFFLGRNATLRTEAIRADGGNIELSAGSMVRLIDSEMSASVGGGPATVGGNIWIDPDFVILQGSSIIANAFEGRGGNIQITTGVFLADPFSLVDASSTFGVSGLVAIRAPVQNISGVVPPLPKDFVSAAELLRTPCQAKMRKGKASSLIVTGKQGIPPEPGGVMPSPLR